LRVGQEIHYAGSSEIQLENSSIKSTSAWRIWVTRQNDDGSWRLVASQSDSSGEVATDENARTTVASFDLHPNGQIFENVSSGITFDPRVVFAALPVDEGELQGQWKAHSKGSDRTYIYSTKASGTSGKLMEIACTVESAFDKIYEATQSDVIRFDMEQGLVRETDGKSTQGWGAAGTGMSRLVLGEIEERDLDWMATLDREMELYSATTKQEEALLEKLAHSATPESLLDEARKLWTKLEAGVSHDEVKRLVTGRAQQFDSYREYRLSNAKKQREVLGKPAADWDTTDLEGKPHRLADYAGKVLVLDFWYRGCGWCIRAMPQLNQVAEDFAGQPVVLLGMNTDSNIEDAKFVEDAMKLKYKSLRVNDELPKKYGVSGFPTVVVIDGTGKVADIHVGYSPTLREKLTESIRAALGSSTEI
jgi:thiol-disulfide isomerase/thioredoxin